VLRLGQTLVGLHARELREAAPVGLVAPDAEARAEHRIAACQYDGIIALPGAAVDDDVVTDLDVADVGADLPDDTRGVAASDVERAVVRVLLAAPDDVGGHRQRGQAVLDVTACGRTRATDVSGLR